MVKVVIIKKNQTCMGGFSRVLLYFCFIFFFNPDGVQECCRSYNVLPNVLNNHNKVVDELA